MSGGKDPHSGGLVALIASPAIASLSASGCSSATELLNGESASWHIVVLRDPHRVADLYEFWSKTGECTRKLIFNSIFLRSSVGFRPSVDGLHRLRPNCVLLVGLEHLI